MASLGLKLPIVYSSVDGFLMTKSLVQMTKQNFKMLLLTNPGERIMEPTYGVGLRTYLFSMQNEDTRGKINTKIAEQVKLYMPYITVFGIQYATSDKDVYTLSMQISYGIPNVGITDLIEVTI
jgi:phage baseplate assembly protein W